MKKYLLVACCALLLCACGSKKESDVYVCKTPDTYEGVDINRGLYDLTYVTKPNSNVLKEYTVKYHYDKDFRERLLQHNVNIEEEYHNTLKFWEDSLEYSKQFDFITFEVEKNDEEYTFEGTMHIDFITDFDYLAEENREVAEWAGYLNYYNQETKQFEYNEDLVKDYLYSGVPSLECSK